MDNYQIADVFSLLAKVMDIHGENPFKIKSYNNAAFQIEKLTSPLSDMPPASIAALRGVGDTIAKKIGEILETGTLLALQDYIDKTPPGVFEMLNIKGLGPKKINTVWKAMEIESLGELLYACNENRLTLYKGFGEKTQQNVKEAIEFYTSQQGRFLYQQVENFSDALYQKLESAFPNAALSATGAYRRQADIIETLEFVIAAPIDQVQHALETTLGISADIGADHQLSFRPNGKPIVIIYCTTDALFAKTLFLTTATPEFLSAISIPPEILQKAPTTEANFFETAHLPYIPACLREDASVLERIKKLGNTIPPLIEPNSIKGIIHSHSTWSDGTHTIEDMAKAAIAKGFEYLVISDHSKTAAYAQGLRVEQVLQQHAEIDALNKQLAPFKIFKSIESDILGDGSLDYDDDMLASFDLVIASVHANLKMTEEKAMQRLIRAIENKYTTILGHPTGRLLLSRNGYPIDHKKIIEACVANHVVIELNAHPRRLDIDWRWISYALDQGALISIDPDAHFIEGFDDIRYGVLAAQKAMLTADRNLSSFSLAAFEQYLANVKQKKV